MSLQKKHVDFLIATLDNPRLAVPIKEAKLAGETVEALQQLQDIFNGTPNGWIEVHGSKE